MSNEKRLVDAEKFLNLLFGKINEKKFSYLCTIDGSGGKKTIRTDEIDVSTADNRRKAAERAIELSDASHNVFTGVNCADSPPLKGRRYCSSDITAQVAIVSDIDIEGGTHVSGAKKKYPPDFATAKSFLPFEPSLTIHSGYGLHAYYLLDTPITVNPDIQKDCEARGKRLIELIRSKAGEFKGGVDGVSDLSRILRLPGTRNFKLGISEDAPICHIVDDTGLRFTLDDFDAKLDSVILAREEKELRPVVKQFQLERKAIKKIDAAFDSAEYDLFRARRMLEVMKTVDHTDLSYGRWLAVITAAKNLGVDFALVDEFCSAPGNGNNYCPEKLLRTWEKLNNPAFDIATLHGIAKDFGYSERDSRQAWRQLHPELFSDPTTGFSSDDYSFYFDGDHSDLQNARRLEKFCGDRVRWLTDDERWLTFDNGIWSRRSEKSSTLLPTVQQFFDFLSSHARDGDAAKIVSCFKQNAKILGAINFLRGCNSILVTAKDLDQHPELLNCQNGCVDLTDGKFYEHAPELLLTQKTNANYDPAIDTSFVEKFFADIQPDETTRRGLLRWLGYGITAETREEKFAVWTGESGANGKSTLAATLINMLGDFATDLPTRALLKKKFDVDGDRATTGLNPVEGRRLGFCEELPQGGELDTALVKNLSGGSKLSLRRNYSEFRTITPFIKLNLLGNYAPRLPNSTDGGLLRRLINFSFDVRFGQGGDKPADPHLKRKLLDAKNQSALLRLLVDEAVAWYRGDDGGLIISDRMKAATREHLAQNSWLADFASDFYVFGNNLHVKTKDFLEHLRSEYPRETSRFSRAELIRLVEKSLKVTYTNGRNHKKIFKGLGRLADNDFCGSDESTENFHSDKTTEKQDLGIDPNDLPFNYS